ncbi:hypothetical protein GGI15_002813 [Coemansia interrupta]|uniref:WLM domain-containing protein n=1 Tax=Coemansia interrupta TaxID=1126814 RepID=A0A9W8HG46_9FUNG|nr:hypothetical protein GGI15_002813 [Coemansia interrupta]
MADTTHWFTLAYKGTTQRLETSTVPTLDALHAYIEQHHGIHREHQKLLTHGLLKGAATTPLSEILAPGSKVLLMGTPSATLDDQHQRETQWREAQKTYAKYAASPEDVRRTRSSADGLNDEYTFHRLQKLDGLPHADRALALLQRLRGDEGVRGIMRRRRYSVGVLLELHPMERSILGYNRNRGEVIALRLRTDDLLGFRTYESVREVLMHELAHMVWDEHDERFHRLNREHCREVVELDWTRRGRTVAGQRARFYEPREEDAAAVDGGALGAQGFVLGGSVPDGAQEASAAELAYRAWQRRKQQ